MDLSPDGKTLAVVDDCRDDPIRIDGEGKLLRLCEVTLWDLPSRTQRCTLAAHESSFYVVNSLAFSPDGKTLCTGAYFVPKKSVSLLSRKALVELWDAGTGEKRRTVVQTDDDVIGGVRSVAFSRDGRQLAAAIGASVSVWDLGRARKHFELGGHRGRVECVAFSPDDKVLAVGAGFRRNSGELALWDAATGEQLTRLTQSYGKPEAMTFSSDGQTLAIRSRGRGIRLLDTATRKIRPTNRALLRLRPGQPRPFDVRSTGPSGSASTLSFAPGDQTLASGAGSSVRLWEAASGKLQSTFSAHTDRVTSVLFAPDGRTLLAGGHGPETTLLKLIDLDAGEQLGTLPDTIPKGFGPGGNILLTRAVNAKDILTVRQASTGSELARLRHPSLVQACFQPNGNMLATTGGGRVMLWDLTRFVQELEPKNTCR
jgi:WD40 repeat protein